MSIITSDPLSLSETLGAMLAAVIDAQAQAARATVDFIEAIGPVGNATDSTDARELRHVTFTYKKLDENFETKKFVLEIPLLSMVDIPLLTVKSAKFSFKYQITRSTKNPAVKSNPTSGTSSFAAGNLVGSAASLSMYAVIPVSLIGKVTKQTVSTQTEEKGGLDVVVEVEKAPLPVGIDKILEMLELAGSDKKIENET